MRYVFYGVVENGHTVGLAGRKTGIDAINIMFEKGGSINFMCGLIDALERVWKIDGKTVENWESLE